MEAKLPKVCPPLPSEECGALPGTNTSFTDPEIYVSLFHIYSHTGVLWEEKQGVLRASMCEDRTPHSLMELKTSS